MKTFPVTVPQLGAAPYVKVVVEYPSGTVTYTDTNKLLEIGQVVVSKRVDNYGEAASVSFTLDDSDGSVKTRIDNTNLVNIPVTVYFVLGVNEMAILKGRLTGELSWDESQRRATFTAEGVTASETSTTLAGLEQLPLGFGTPLKVRAIPLQKVPYGAGVGYQSQGNTNYVVSNGVDFPQNTQINVDFWISNEPPIANNGGSAQVFNNDSPLRMTGTFAGNIFTPTAKNIPIYTVLAIGSRDLADPDNTDKSVMWLNTDDAYIGGLWVKFNNQINYCLRQRGRKCFFWSPLVDGYTVISEVAGTVRASWGGQYTHPSYGVVDNVDKFTLWPQCTVKQHLPDPTEVYCYNGISGATVLKVYAKRSFGGETILSEVPSSYYIKDNNYVYGGIGRSVIKFTTPLEHRAAEKWSSDSIYVTAISSVGKNTVDQLQYIVDSYTSLAIDTASFLSVKTAVNYYPSNFVVDSTQSPITLIQDIARQARIGVQIDAGVVKLRYLSKVPAVDLIVTDDDIKLSSVTLGFPNPDDLSTEIEYTWRENYYDDQYTYIYRNNVDLYGLKLDSINMFIYNDKALVQKSADWIGARKSNVWRKVKFKTMLNALGLETNDCIALQSDTVSSNTIKSDVDSVVLDLNEYTYEVGLTLASKSGTVDADSRAYEDLTYWTIDELTAMPAAPESGLTETDFVVPVDPQRIEPNPSSGQKLKLVITEDAKEVSTVTRNTSYVFVVSWLDSSDNLITGLSQPFTVVFSDSGDETFTATVSGTISTEGTGTAAFTITGGTGELSRKIKFGWGSNADGLYGSYTIQISPEPTPKWDVWPTGVSPEELFDVSITDMLPSTVYSVTLVGSTDCDLEDASAPVTTITSDPAGTFTGQWKFTGGALAVTDCSVVLGHSAYEYSSPSIIIVSTSAPNLVYKHTGVLTVGTAVAAPSWSLATSADETIGVVAKVTATHSYIVVRGLACIIGLTENTKYYVTAAGVLDTADTGAFVLKAYMDDFVWIGGSSDAGKLEKLKDVTLTSLSNKDILIYDSATTKWKNRQLATATDADRLVVSDAIKDKAVTFAKFQDVAGVSVTGNAGNALGVPASILCSTANAVLLSNGANSGLSFGLIADANISASAAISYTKINFAGWSGTATPGTLTASTGLSGTSFNGSTNVSWSVVYGSSAGTACQGNDSRLSDARVPVAHTHTLAGDVTGDSAANTVTKLQGRSVATTAPATNEVLKWNGSAWAPGTASTLPADAAGYLKNNGSGTLSWSATVAWSELSGVPVTFAPSAHTHTLAGDVTGNSASNTVTRIRGIPVNSSGIALDASFNDSPITYYHTGAGGAPEFEVGGIIGLKFGGTGQSGVGVSDPNKVFATPASGTGNVSYRSLVVDDIPGLPWSKITSGVPDFVTSAHTHTLAGDVSGTTGASTVDKIKGRTVDFTNLATAGTLGCQMFYFTNNSDSLVVSNPIGTGTNGAQGALLTAYATGPTSFEIGEVAPVAAAETGYLLGIDTDLSAANAKPKWLRAIKLGKGEGAGSASVGSLLVVTTTTGSHAIINGSGISIKKAAEATAKVAISEDGIMALGNSGTGIGASLQVFNKTTGNFRLEMGASNFRKINANGTYTAMTVKTFTTTTGVPAEAGELGDVVLVTL